MATTITRYVNTGSTTGGDGTTNATSGANRAYVSIFAALTALYATYTDLTTSDVVLDIRCSGTSADAGYVNFASFPFTTDATRYVMITGESTGKRDTSKYRLEIFGSIVVNVPVAYTRFYNVAFRNTNGYTTIECGSPGAGYELHCYNCVFDQIGQTQRAGVSVINSAGVSTKRIVLVNCVAVGNADKFITWNYSSATANVLYNNSIRLSGAASSYLANFTNGGGTLYFKNNVLETTSAGNCINRAGQTFTTAGNITSDTTSPETALRSITLTYTDAANGDLSLASSDTAAINAASDLSADSIYAFATDAAGTSRPQGSAWDIGAWEYLSVASVAVGYQFTQAVWLF